MKIMPKISDKHRKTLAAVFARPVSPSIKWADIESLFVALDAEIEEREGSRISVTLGYETQVFHRPHPKPETDKGAVNAIRKWLEKLGYYP